MARCGCEGLTCACAVEAGDATVTVTGVGTGDNPYSIKAVQGYVNVLDTPTIDMHKTGTGVVDDPYVISGYVIADLDDLADVAASSPTAGYVLAWNGTAWAPAPPTTAAVGAVSVGSCLSGDGSSGDPVSLDLDPSFGGLRCVSGELTAAPDFITWDHNWHSEEGTLHYGTSDILAEYARLGQLCYLRFQWSSASGFTGGNGPWHWTAPFPVGTPTGQAIAGRLRTKSNRTYLGAAIIASNSDDIQFLAPVDNNTTYSDAVQQQGPVSAGGPGSGIPLVGGDYTFDDTATSRLSWQGWYRVKAGF